MPNQITQLQTDVRDPQAPRGALVDIVVLTRDPALFDSIRSAVGDRHPAWRAPTSEEAVDMLLIGRCGVLIVDMAAVSTQPASLIEQIHSQFPDVVVVVAGDRDDEPALAGLVGEGLIYRYMHKPLSEKRATMFLSAAIRQYSDRRGARDFEPLRPLIGRRPDKTEKRYWSIAGGVIVAVVVGVAVLTYQRKPPIQVLPPPSSTHTQAHAVSDAPRADPVLSRARAALDAGRYESPAGRNALDLYQAVLLAKPDHTEARAGLERTIDAILLSADAARRSGNAQEAKRLVSRVLAVDPQHEAAKALLASLQPPPPAQPVPAPVATAQTAPVTAPEQSAPASIPVPPVAKPAAMTAGSTAAAPEAKSGEQVRPVTQPASVAVEHPAQPASASATAGPKVPTPAPPKAPVAASTPAPPAVSTKAPTTAPVPASAPPKRPVSTKPMPDPLQPSLAMSSPKRSASRARAYGAPISSGQPIAGIDTRPAVSQPVQSASSASANASTGPARAPSGVEDTGSPRAEFVDSSELEQLVAIDPVYPTAAMRDRVTGWVTLEFTVTPTGGVRDILVTDSEPYGVFDAAATKAVSQWRFTPRVSNGRAVAIRSAVTLHFDVDR